MAAQFDSVTTVLAALGQPLGSTDWVLIDQVRINLFADATGDHQWIHVDPERAKHGPFGACVAHGYLTLSLANLFLPQLVSFERLKMGVNYGCDKVRFPAPVRVDSRVRGRGEVVAAEAIAGGGVQVTVRVTVEIEGQDKPGCVVDTISRLYFEQPIPSTD
jgi:acyl dehydratase